jgi:hypothetical protein
MFCITERLARRVKGVTHDFCVLLLINPGPDRHPAVLSQLVAAAAKRLWWRERMRFQTADRPTRKNPKPGWSRQVATAEPRTVLSVRRFSTVPPSQGGGFESLVIPFDCDSYRTATKWAPGAPTLRLPIGLDNVDDLKANPERGFGASKANA